MGVGFVIQKGKRPTPMAYSRHSETEGRASVDLEISGKKAIVCGASKGLGKACAKALASEGVDVWIAARTEAVLSATAAEFSDLGGKTEIIVADVTNAAGRDRLFEECPHPDIIVNNAGGPPPGDFRDWGQQEWFDAVNGNMYSAIDMIKRSVDGMVERGFGRIVNITSVAVKMPVEELGLSNGARSGLTGFIAGLARSTDLNGVTINNLLPGMIATDRLAALMDARADAAGQTTDDYMEAFFARIPSRRPGDPDEFGALCAFLCSTQAAYITGQNILMDGGLYPGTF